MNIIILVAFGGALGSLIRYFTEILCRRFSFCSIPIGTITVNIIGSFLIGYTMQYLLSRNIATEEYRRFIMTGFLGGLTTFSSFSLEILEMLQDGKLFIAVSYVLLSISLGLLGVWLGISIASNSS
ncbi:MAG: fluoride efflux transporter CrcB [bacterium]|tara:strand:+ start:151 stop:528 length:378 start_codon:yes stop_codon:yes gene_type:complete